MAFRKAVCPASTADSLCGEAAGEPQYTGHLYAGILALGFTALCLVEGGMEGHAIAWLAAVPLCALLLLNLRSALAWSGVCFLLALGFGIAQVLGYPPQWHSVISLMAGGLHDAAGRDL